MTLPANDFSNRELSIEELEAIAAGFSFGGVLHWIKHEALTVLHYAVPIIEAYVKTAGQPPRGPGQPPYQGL